MSCGSWISARRERRKRLSGTLTQTRHDTRLDSGWVFPQKGG
jgi:hypothetical protein